MRAITLALTFWMGAATWAEPAAGTTPAPGGRIVVLGDSITAGFGLPDAEQAYPALLQGRVAMAKLPYTVANAGVSGDTTASGLRRVDWALSRGAAVLVIALGGNDGLRGISPRETAANLAGIIQRARAKVPGIAILLAGMQMPDNMGSQYVEEYRALFPRVSAENGVTLLPYLLEGVGGDPKLNQADLIHPTAEGQQRIAAHVWQQLEPLLAARSTAP